jgi:exopolyphosphatase/guanosine-5'-triphosphate,3'-diphosphate pyrophosphatase
MLHETGKFMNYQGHHRHTQYIIANSELYGFTPEQRAVTAAIARYTGKSRPVATDRVMRMVPLPHHPHVQRAVVLLRLAVALHQDRASDVLRVRTRVYPKRVLLELVPGRTGAELELWMIRKEADYFREVFGRGLFAEVV